MEDESHARQAPSEPIRKLTQTNNAKGVNKFSGAAGVDRNMVPLANRDLEKAKLEADHLARNDLDFPCREFNEVPGRIQPALTVLLEAWQYAEQTTGEYWEFAVELPQLSSLGLTTNDFRWLVRKGWVEHQREITIDGDTGRVFRPTGDLRFPEGSCFILTAAGAAVAANISCVPPKAHSSPSASTGNLPAPPAPHWDPESRELRIGSTIVKRFKWHAINQEMVLCAFQEEGWPTRIDDPLPPQPEQDSKRRLSDTIKCLNRKQTNQLIHFRGDGTGEGVIWERVE